MGQTFRHLGKLDDSIADFKKAARLEPENGAWYYEIGVSLYELGDRHRALKLFSVALDGKAALKAPTPSSGNTSSQPPAGGGNTCNWGAALRLSGAVCGRNSSHHLYLCKVVERPQFHNHRWWNRG